MLDEAGAEADVRPALALLAAPEPLIEPDELTPALRRAMLLLAAGGDPQRELELGGRAGSALAAELGRPGRRPEVSRGLGALAEGAAGLAHVCPAMGRLVPA